MRFNGTLERKCKEKEENILFHYSHFFLLLTITHHY